MRTIEGLRRSGVGIEANRTIHDAESMMEQTGVGVLAVLDGGRLVGIVTDRDLVRRGLARSLLADARVDGVMTSPVVTIDDDTGLDTAFGPFRTQAVRRLAVVRGGHFIGMITVDDLIVDLTADLHDLSRPVEAEILLAQRDSLLPATR